MAQFYQMPKKKEEVSLFEIENPMWKNRIRLAKPEDAQSILKVYTPYILDTTITFEYDVPTCNDFAQRLELIRQTYPILVCEVEGEIVGYAYAAVFKPRSAYQWTAETVIYFKNIFVGKGFGKILYEGLIEVLKLQGICQGIAVITSGNERSIEFHRQIGFQPAAKLVNVGYKFGKWLDVDWMQFHFAELKEKPEPMLPIGEIVKGEQFLSLIAELNKKLNPSLVE